MEPSLPTTTTASLTERIVDGRYALLRSLGAGSAGEVWLAADQLRPGRRVALKLIPGTATAGTDAASDSGHEFLLLTRLRHPHIARVHEMGRDSDGTRYLTMAWVRGESLDRRLGSRGVLPMEAVVRLGVELTRALAFSHARGVLHRDIKPSNVMLADSGSAVLLDFGLAALADGPSRAAGTLRYLAPEVLRRRQGRPADLFGLGCTLYEAAVGIPFLVGDDTGAVSRLLRDSDVFAEHLSRSMEAVEDAGLSAIIESLLRWDPELRPPSAASVLDTLGRLTVWDQPLETQASSEAWVVPTRLVARDDALRLVREWASADALAHRRLLVVEGQQGVGKSRLLDDVLHEARSRGERVLQGWCTTVGSSGLDGVLGLVYEALPSASSELVRAHGPALCKVLPDHPRLDGLDPAPRHDPQTEEGLAIEAVASFLLGYAAEHRGHVFLRLEQLGSAGRGTLSVIDRILFKQATDIARGLRLTATLSPDAPAPVTEALARLSQRRRLERVPVEPLGPDDVSDWASAVFGDEVSLRLLDALEAIRGQVEGLPLHLQEALRGLVSSGRVRRAGAWWTIEGTVSADDVPDTLREAAERRLAEVTLGPAEEAVLIALAALGRPADAALLSLTEPDLGPEVLELALERLEALGLVASERHDEGLTHRLGRPALAGPVRDRVLPPRLRAVHGRIAAALARRYARRSDLVAAELARHHREAGKKSEACEWLLRAAAAATGNNASEQAIEHLEQAIMLLGLGSRRKRWEALMSLAERLEEVGRWDDAEARLDQAAEVAGSVRGRPTFKIDVNLRRALLDIARGRYTGVVDVLSGLRKAYEHVGGSEGLFKTLGGLGRVHFLQARYPEALAALEAQLELADAGNPRDVAEALGALGRVHTYQQRFDLARPMFERQLALAEEAHDRRQTCSAMAGLGMMHRRQGRYDEALACFQAKLETCERIGDVQGVGVSWGNLAVANWYRGDIGQAVACCERQLVVAEEIGDLASVVSVQGNMGEFRKAQGDHAAAAASYDAALALARELELTFFEGHYAAGKADLCRLMGAWDEALEYAARAQEIAARIDDAAMRFEARLAELGTLARRDGGADDTTSSSSSAAMTALAAMLTDGDLDPEQQARVHDELYQLGAGAEHGRAARGLYLERAAATNNPRLRARADALGTGDEPPEAAGDSFGPRLDELMGLVRTISSSMETDSILERVVDLALRFVGAERGFVMLAHGQSMPTVHMARDHRGEALGVEGLTWSRTVVQRTIDQCAPVYLPNVLDDSNVSVAASVLAMDLRSVMCLPLTRAADPGDPDVLGVLYVDSSNASHAKLRGQDLRYVQMLADQAAVALANAARYGDIDHRLAERTRELAEYMDALRAEISRRERVELELRETAAELERSNRDLEQFAHIASHDLHSPLQAMSGYCELLARRYEGQLGREADSYIDYIVEGSRRMGRLIDDLLEWSKLDSNVGDPVAVALDDVVATVLTDLQPRIADLEATVEVASPLPTVNGHWIQLVQLLQNLVGNALKFSTDASPVVKVYAQTDDSTGDVTVTVEDRGPGVPEAERERIFEAFARLHSRDEVDGSGIGLAVCRRIAVRHNGRILVETPASGVGAAFKLRLPGLAADAHA